MVPKSAPATSIVGTRARCDCWESSNWSTTERRAAAPPSSAVPSARAIPQGEGPKTRENGGLQGSIDHA